MLDLVARGVSELPALIDALATSHGIDRKRVALVGISMGAFLAYHAVACAVPLRSVVALLGSPEWPDERSPHARLEAFRHVSLLSITAEHDTHVPGAPVHRLHLNLAIRHPTSIHRYHVLRGAGHLTSGAEWDDAMHATLAWLVQTI